MCEILFWKAAFPLSGIGAIDCERPIVGTGITSQPDGWKWTKIELTNPDWRIIAVPGLAPSTGQSFCAKDANYGLPSFPLARRYGFAIDTTKITAQALVWWNDDTRATPILTLNLTASQLAFIRKSVTAIA